MDSQKEPYKMQRKKQESRHIKSGRSDITDFEEVVKLDTEYIENWSIGLDCRIYQFYQKLQYKQVLLQIIYPDKRMELQLLHHKK